VRLKDDTREWFCENVRSVLNTRSVLNNEGVGFDMGANEMIPDVNVLGLSVVGVIA
jgi:hypothetical protein